MSEKKKKKEAAGKFLLSHSLSLSLLQVEGVGLYFRQQLLQSRHRGAFELAYVGFVRLTDTLCRCVLTSRAQARKANLRSASDPPRTAMSGPLGVLGSPPPSSGLSPGEGHEEKEPSLTFRCLIGGVGGGLVINAPTDGDWKRLP